MCSDSLPTTGRPAPPKSSGCTLQRAMLFRERLATQNAKFARNFDNAVSLAQRALDEQKARFLHESECPVCRLQPLDQEAQAA
jgi:hypothetical protein